MTSTSSMTMQSVECELRFHRRGRGARKVRDHAPIPVPPVIAGRVPRVSRLMALAIHLDQLIRDGVVADQAALARLGHVTRARVSQIMNLLNLAPDIQEAILFLPRYTTGRAPVILADLRPIANEPAWEKQREMGAGLRGRIPAPHR